MGKAELVMMIFEQSEVENRLEKMSNDQIADLLLEHVWADMDLTTPQSTLVDVAITRLRSSARIVESNPREINRIPLTKMFPELENQP